MKNIAIFASGEGTNAESIITYFRRPGSKAAVTLVITNRSDAGVVGRAEALGVDCTIMTRDEFRDTDSLLAMLDRHKIDIIVLAGFLLMIPPALVDRYRGRIVNIHPALLPAFGGKGMYGRHVHEAVVASGATETGITIHHVNEHYDDGDIIFQASVPVEPADTPDDVARKVRTLELTHFAPTLSLTFGL